MHHAFNWVLAENVDLPAPSRRSARNARVWGMSPLPTAPDSLHSPGHSGLRFARLLRLGDTLLYSCAAAGHLGKERPDGLLASMPTAPACVVCSVSQRPRMPEDRYDNTANPRFHSLFPVCDAADCSACGAEVCARRTQRRPCYHELRLKQTT